MAKRKGIPKKARFEVFKRDKFTCQYCGMAAPDVILHVDHIEPHSKGGSDEILNLLTSCSSCNSGKGARPLSDDSAIQKQKAMLDSLQERREQIEMMLDWQRGLRGLADDTIAQIAEFWNERTTGWMLNENGLAQLRKWVSKFSTQAVIEAMTIAAEHYLVVGEDMWVTAESREKAFKSIPGICFNRRREAENPNHRVAAHIVSVARKRYPQVTPQRLGMLRNLILRVIEEDGADSDFLFSLLFTSTSISSFEYKLSNCSTAREEK